MIDVTYSYLPRYFIRYFYDLSVWGLINIILINLIFGTIIDAFAGMLFILPRSEVKK